MRTGWLFAQLIALVIFLFEARAQSVEPQGQLYYQPPVLPLQISIGQGGEVSVFGTNQVVTPIGVFGVGAGFGVTTNANHTYFLVRQSGRESVYCVGASGRLRLKTNGRSVVDIFAANGYPNVFIMEVRVARGTFEVEFVPDPGASELARIRVSEFTRFHVVLLRNGDIWFDVYGWDSTISASLISSVSLFGLDDSVSSGNATLRIVTRGSSAELRSAELVALSWKMDKKSTLESRWFYYVFAKIAPGKIRPVRRLETFSAHEGRSVSLYDDGSIYVGYGGRPIELIGIETVERVEHHPGANFVNLVRRASYCKNVALFGGQPDCNSTIVFNSTEQAKRVAAKVKSELTRAR